jgi:hypothetical protein
MKCISQSTEAYTLFSEGKTPIEVAIALNLRETEATQYNKEYRKIRNLDGDIYPAVGGDLPGNFGLNSTHALAANVTGITVPLSGHWIPEEQPSNLLYTKQLQS